MPLGEIPIWGQWGILGLSIGLNVYLLVRIAMGLLVPHQQIDDIRKESDSWQHAWEVSHQTSSEAAALVSQLTVIGTTMEKVLNALPPAQTAHVVVMHNGEPR